MGEDRPIEYEELEDLKYYCLTERDYEGGEDCTCCGTVLHECKLCWDGWFIKGMIKNWECHYGKGLCLAPAAEGYPRWSNFYGPYDGLEECIADCV